MLTDDIPIFHLKPSLIDLVKRGESAPVIYHLEKHPEEVDQCDESGFYPIHHAIQEKQSELITILIEYGASLYKKGPQNITSLMLAALHGMAAKLKLSRVTESDIQMTDDGGNTVGHYLAFNGDLIQWDMMDIPEKEIIRHNKSGKSPLQLLIEEGNCSLFFEILKKELVQKELNVHLEKFTNLCVRGGSHDILKAMLSLGNRSEARWNSLVEQCCVLGKPASLREMLEWGGEQQMQIDTNRLKAVPSGLITPEISSILSNYL